MATKGKTEKELWQALEGLDADLLDPGLPESAVDDELKALGVDPLALAKRASAFVAVVKEEERLSWQERAHQSRAQLEALADGPGEGTWSVFAQKVVEERDQLRDHVESLKAQLACAQAFHDVAVKERDLAHAQLTPAMRERDELFEQVASLKSQLAAAQRAYDRALAQRDEAKAEVARMKARPAEAEYECLDEVWKRMEKQRDEAFEQRDKAKVQLKRTRAAVKLVAAERDAAREEAARPSAWLLSEGNMLVRKFAAIREVLTENGWGGEHKLAQRIDAVLNGKTDET